ncbi:MAG: polyprenyl diphosphate synthase [Candidatus Pacearchaeota archaeon]
MNEEMRVPLHIAVIPDGNRRWAKEQGFVASKGYSRGGDYEHLKSLVNEARRLGTKYFSFWGFSTENWARGESEKNEIFKLVLRNIEKFRKDALENNLRFRHIGRKDRLPENILSELEKLEKETEKFSDFNVLLCLDYGGRDEIVRAVRKIISEKISLSEINEKKFSSYLDTKDIPDVDLIIRTAGEKRLSGFMPFQSTYSELYFSEKFFPEFGADDLRKAIEEYGKRKRNFGA